MRRLERLCDCVIRLESFAGSVKEQNPLYKEYHGERVSAISHCLIHNVFSRSAASGAASFTQLSRLPLS